MRNKRALLISLLAIAMATPVYAVKDANSESRVVACPPPSVGGYERSSERTRVKCSGENPIASFNW